MVIADLDLNAPPAAPKAKHSPLPSGIASRPISEIQLRGVENERPGFVVKFTEDKQGFYINGKKYGPNDPPMTVVSIGRYVRWTVLNETDEIHPFHIHQVHFLVYANNGQRSDDTIWMDTVNVPSHGSVDLVMDFTDHIIKGMSLFHCHLLKHEDKGMMAKILFQ